LQRPWLWWLAVLVPLWLVFTACAYWEPVAGDGWGNFAYYRTFEIGITSLWNEAVGGWKSNNPRAGQLLTLLAYGPHVWHVVLTPLAELGLFALLAAIVRGRWPSLRRGDDLLLFVLIVALLGVCAPQFGMMLFYRPYAGNYTHALALNLLWLVPYRFAVEPDHGPRLWRTGAAHDRAWRGVARVPVMLALGFVAGFCNEHTGPAIGGAAALASVVAWRRGALRAWMLAGLIGFVAGFALLIFAPGQNLRYSGLATQASLLHRITARGVGGNLWVIVLPILTMWPAVPAIALGLAARRTGAPLTRTQRGVLAAAAAGGLVIAVTLLGSPKIGYRLSFASNALWCAALASWVTDRCTGGWRIAAAALAGATLAFVLIMLFVTYRAVGPVGAARARAIAAGPPGTTVVVPRYPIDRSRWFIGEDLDTGLRDRVAVIFGLARIELRD